jgi:hypothetical protein
MSVMPARAGVHRADHEEPRGEDGGACGASHGHGAELERLAEHFQGAAVELGHLVEKEHAVVREADLTGTGDRSASCQRDIGDRVVRRAERPQAEQAAWRQDTCHRMDRARLERLLEGERRKNPRGSPRHHRLPATGRSDEEEMVTACGRDLERPAGHRLSAHLAQVRLCGRSGRDGRCRPLLSGCRGIIQHPDRLGQ